MNTLRRPTFLQVIVVIAVLGVLMGLLLPPQQGSREAARGDARSWSAAPASATSEAKNGGSAIGTRSTVGGEPLYQTALQVDDEAAQAGAEIDAPAVARKIIYEAQLSLVVDDLEATETALNKLLAKFHGYAAEANVARQQGERLTGQWRVRIPVDQFEAFMDAVAGMGVAETRQQTAQDVTEEFVDLAARIANKKKLEERIVELLASSTGKITDVIQVENELARVRGEIEQMEGRLRYLSNRAELTTVTITVREEHDYVPPAAPTFASRIALAWQNSLQSLQDFGQRLGIAAVSATPWVATFVVVLAPLAWLARRVVARRRLRGPTPPFSVPAAS